MTSEAWQHYADAVGRLLFRVYEIHESVLSKGGGGIAGLRDATMLHAAVARPFATFEGVELYPTDFEKAAAKPIRPKTVHDLASWLRQLVGPGISA